MPQVWIEAAFAFLIDVGPAFICQAAFRHYGIKAFFNPIPETESAAPCDAALVPLLRSATGSAALP